MTTSIHSADLDCFLIALLAGDGPTCTQITDRTLSRGTDVLGLYEGIYRPALYRVGELWSENRLSVASEHMATAVTEGLMNHLYAGLINPKRAGRKAMLATVEGELHQVGVKMAADVFELHGWDASFPGVGLSTDDLLSALALERPDVLGLSLCVCFHLDALESMLERIRDAQPGLPILIGGQGLDQGAQELATGFAGVRCIHSLAELDALIPTLESDS